MIDFELERNCIEQIISQIQRELSNKINLIVEVRVQYKRALS